MLPKIGIDIVEIKDFNKSITRSGEIFLEKIFTEEELVNREVVHLAGIFALKEALVKVGIIKPGEWLKIKIKNYKDGKPVIFKKDHLLKSLTASVSHSKNTAVAVVLINNNDNDRSKKLH